ncbi:MAG: hypothetical protein JNM21_14935 [Taibaiella sp.]|nr:hypothetical protein [Taibaiella sp.]
MSILKNLEDFRHNVYLSPYLVLFSDSNKPMAEMTYNHHAMHAFYSLSDDVNDLENEKNFVNNGRRTLSTIALCYLSLEAFINSLCKIVSAVFDHNPEQLIKSNLGARVTYLSKELGYDESELKKTGIYNRIDEFKQFRNELFHAKYVNKEIVFKRTNFSSIPILSNQVDSFQAILITIEIMTLFRYSITGLDLMPNISIGNQAVLHFDKLNVLYLKYLKPYFESALAKHNLATELNLDISDYRIFPPSPLIHQSEIVVILRAVQEDKYQYPLNQNTTTIGENLYSQLVQSYNLPAGHTSGLNFIVNWESFYKSTYPMRR